MKPTARRLVSLSAAAPLVLLTLAATASPALADRCEPDEIVLRPVAPGYESPIDDTLDTCGLVFDPLIYDNVNCDDTTFMRCVTSYAGNTASKYLDPGPDPLSP